MRKVQATQVFLGTEGRWKAGEIRELEDDRAGQLLTLGLVEEVEKGEPEVPTGADGSPAAARETKPRKLHQKLETK